MTLTATPALVTPEPAASALEYHHGPGVNWGNGVHVYGAGAFIVAGKFVYCVEPWIRSGTALPTFVGGSTIPGKSSGGITVDETAGVPLQQISFLLARYGQTNDNAQAAAVALAIWEIRGADGRGNAGYQAEVAKVHTSVGPEVVALAHRLTAEAVAWTDAIAHNSDLIDTPILTVDPAHPYRGTVAVPAGTLTLQIKNGVFGNGGSTRSWDGSGAPPGTSLSWQGQPAASDWDKYYRVTFSGSYLAISTTVQWGDGDNWQSTITVEEPEELPLQQAYADIDTTWAPEVASLVTNKFVRVGEPHSDEVIFAAAAASPGISGEWRWRIAADGRREWMPITAEVTVYGPFLTDPALNPAFEAPIGAPVAAHATFTTDPTRDHTSPQQYPVRFDTVIAEQGYYTYKWDIHGNRQDPAVTGAADCDFPTPEVGCRALPKNYFFSDGFGSATETQVGKMEQRFTTQLSTHETSLDASFTDAITIPEMQNWLRDGDGARLPLTLTGTAYLTVGAELTQSVQVPADAVPLATVRVTTDPQANGQRLVSEPVTIPVTTGREYTHVTMLWCIVDADQEPRAQGFWVEHCDDFGVPEESARIVHPEVRTQAQPLGTRYDPLVDTAIVDGPIPAHTWLVFELFQQPPPGAPDLGGDANEPAAAAVCTPQTLVVRTSPVPVRAGLNTAASYQSPAVHVSESGTYWWVESLVHVHPDTGVETVLLRGHCGAPNETSVVDTPTVRTRAVPTVLVGEETADLAIVTGPVPGPASGVRTELTFQAFQQQGGSARCDASTLVVDLSDPIPVGIAGEYRSAPVRFHEPGTYYWVETLSYVLPNGDREVVHTGTCGLPHETTRVLPRPVIAVTGLVGSLAPFAWVALGGGGLFFACGLTLWVRRSLRARAPRLP